MDHTRLPRATGEDSKAHRWRPCRLGSGAAGSPGPRGRSEESDGAPHHVAVPAQPRRGCGKGARPSLSHGGAGPCGQAARGAHTAPPTRGLGGWAATAASQGLRRTAHPMAKKVRLAPPPPGGAPAPAGPPKAPVTFCRRQDLPPPSGVHACEPAPWRRRLRTRAAYLTQGHGLVENSSCPGGTVWTELSRRKGHGCSRPSPGKAQRPRRGQGTSEGPLSDPELPPRLRLRPGPALGPPDPAVHVLCPPQGATAYAGTSLNRKPGAGTQGEAGEATRGGKGLGWTGNPWRSPGLGTRAAPAWAQQPAGPARLR